jgi:hypothetical protein
VLLQYDMPGIDHNIAFLAFGRAQQPEHRKLVGFPGYKKSQRPFSIKAGMRTRLARLIRHLRRLSFRRESSVRKDRSPDPGLLGNHNEAQPGSVAQTVIARPIPRNIWPRFQVVDRSSQIFHLLNDPVPLGIWTRQSAWTAFAGPLRGAQNGAASLYYKVDTLNVGFIYLRQKSSTSVRKVDNRLIRRLDTFGR